MNGFPGGNSFAGGLNDVGVVRQGMQMRSSAPSNNVNAVSSININNHQSEEPSIDDADY